MSKKRLEDIVIKHERQSVRRGKGTDKAQAEIEENKEKALKSVEALTTTADVAWKLNAVAPPFSTIAAVVAVTGVAAWSGAKGIKLRRSKFLNADEKMLERFSKRYSKKSKSWRKKQVAKLLKRYDRHLERGNKRKRIKNRKSWQTKKARLEMKLKALYGAQFKVDYERTMANLPPDAKPPTVAQKQAEKRVVAGIKQKQKESIDPTTAPPVSIESEIQQASNVQPISNTGNTEKQSLPGFKEVPVLEQAKKQEELESIVQRYEMPVKTLQISRPGLVSEGFTVEEVSSMPNEQSSTTEKKNDSLPIIVGVTAGVSLLGLGAIALLAR